MASKKIEIEVGVNTDQLDKASSKLGELKKLSSKISVQYDIDGKPIDIVIDKTLNLGQQVKVLTAELRKTKEGTAEFTLLNSKLKDSQDNLTRVNAKSRDLFASFSLIPGPIGEIFGKLNGVIGLLKTFSGFSLKDFGNQFKEFGKDITGIYDAIFGLNKEIDQTTSTLNDNTDAQQDNADAIDEGNTATNAGTIANQKQTTAIEGLNKVEKDYIQLNKEKVQGLQENIKVLQQGIGAAQQNIRDAEKNVQIGRLNIEDGNKQIQVNKDIIAGKELKIKTTQEEIASLEKESAALQQNTGNTSENTVGKEVNTKVTKTAAVANTVLAGAIDLVTFATNALNIALKAIGIGFVIAAVAMIVDKLYNWGKSLLAVTEAQKGLTEANKKGNEALATARNKVEEVGVAFEQAAKGTITKKQALETYNEILGGTIGQAKTLEEAEKLYKDNTGNYIKAVGLRAEAQELFSLAAKQSAEAMSLKPKELFSFGAFFDNERKLFQGERTTFIDELFGRKGLYEERVDEFNKNADIFRNKAKVLTAEALALQSKFPGKPGEKKPDTKIENDNKKANELLLKLKQENTVNILNEERKKQDAQLKIDKENEEREIKNLKLSKDKEELRAKLLEQVRVKYGIKVIELNKKRQEEDNKTFDEDQKKIKEYNDKVFEIMNAADESEIGRNKATRQRKYEDDVAALQKDTKFQAQSLEEKIRILLLLEKGLKQDLQKLDDDDAQDKRDKNLKKLEDELKFLQIRGEALIEGTKRFYDNQRAILKAAEKKELADLEDRGIKEKLSKEEIEREKTEILKKYAKARADIAKKEIDDILGYAQAVLGAAQNIVGDIGKVAALGQQVATEEATKRYIAQNELDKKTITNQEQQEAKLLENKKKFAKEEDELKRKAFEENKKIQIAQAIISTLQSAISAYSSLAVIPIVGPVLGGIAAAAALVFGYKQVDLIKKTSYQSSLALSESETPTGNSKTNYGRNYAKGGMIGGRRHAEGGTLIEAEKGEAIMTRGAVTAFAPLLSLMNQAGGGTSFNSNLMTTRQDNPIVNNPAQEQSPLIVKTYVVSQELTTEAHKQARLKNLSTI